MDMSYFPFWKDLDEAQRQLLQGAAIEQRVPAGTMLHAKGHPCVGFVLVLEGRLRAYMLSDEGKELTLYRLLSRDMCLFSAACTLRGADFDISVEAETDSLVVLVPPDVYRQLMDGSLSVSRYTNELMAARFSDVMWLMDQVMNKRMDSRLAALLLEESELMDTGELHLTHEQLARHLGSVREVITRMLRYFQSEGLVRLSRGVIELTDVPGLEALAEDSRR